MCYISSLMPALNEANLEKEPATVAEAREPASYLFGDELRKLQALCANQTNHDGSPHTPWYPGEVFNRLLPNSLEEFRKHETSLGTTEEEITAKEQAEISDYHKIIIGDIETLYDIDAQQLFPSIASLHSFIEQRRDYFTKQANEREHMLDIYKSKFIELAEFAISHQGLPLSKQQLHYRLDGVRIGYSDPWNIAQSGAIGEYHPESHSISVHIKQFDSDLQKTIFHELLHAISGQRLVTKQSDNNEHIVAKRVGLNTSQGNQRYWLNEAVTESLTNLLTIEEGRYAVNFGDTSNALPMPNSNNAGLYAAYSSEIESASLALMSIPANTLLRAYFAQDNDPFEEDQRAGVRAERDLWRAIKMASGVKRIKELRLLEHGFDNDQAKERSIDTALLMATYDNQLALIRKRLQRRAVQRNTRQRSKMINKARQYAKDQE